MTTSCGEEGAGCCAVCDSFFPVLFSSLLVLLPLGAIGRL